MFMLSLSVSVLSYNLEARGLVCTKSNKSMIKEEWSPKLCKAWLSLWISVKLRSEENHEVNCEWFEYYSGSKLQVR